MKYTHPAGILVALAPTPVAKMRGCDNRFDRTTRSPYTVLVTRS